MIRLDGIIVKFSIILIVLYSFKNMNGQNLQKHKWENRILIVKTSDINSDKYVEQIKELENSDAGMRDRKFVLYKIYGDQYKMTDFQNNKLNNSGTVASQYFGKILNDNYEFEIILIGLDGGVKLQQTEILTKQELYETVDSMQMRSSEIKRNRTKN